MPKPLLGRNSYHIDPHPHFSPQGSYVVYTTTVRNLVDVAVTPVEPVCRLLTTK